MNLTNLFEDDSRTPNPNYAEELAYQIFKVAPGLDTTGAADEVLDYAFDLAVNDLGRKRAHSLFAYDEDFDSDLVNAYLDLQMNQKSVAEGLPKAQDGRYNPDGSKKKQWHQDPRWQQHAKAHENDPKNIYGNLPKKVKEGQLNEYLVKAGMPVKDVLALNLFQDFDPVEGAAAQFPEFAQEPMWKQVVRKYAPIANMLKKKLLATKRPLTDAEAEAVEQTWYDGSDAYDDMEIEYLIDIYDQQIDTLEALLAGNLTDEEFLEQGVAEGGPYDLPGIDYPRPGDTPAKPRYRGQQTPGVNPDDEAYFREIWRKNKLAQQQKEREADHERLATGTNESRMSELDAEYQDYKNLSPREFYNMYKMTKQQWFEKYKGLLQGVTENADVDVSVVVGKLYNIIDHAEDVIKTADFDSQVQKATIVRDRATKALNMIKSGTDAGSAFKYFQSGQQGVAEADKKKDELEPEVRDVALQRAITRAKADFPTAGSGLEALAKGFMRSQDEDQKSFDQIRQAERKQDQMLDQIAKIDQEQEQEIQGLEQQNSGLASRLQQLQNVNSELEKKLAAMSGRKAEKKSKSDSAAAPAPTSAKAPQPVTKKPAKSKSKPTPQKSAMKSTAAQLAAPKADPMAAMADRIERGDAAIINPKQSALPFEPSDNVLEPAIPQSQVNPKFAAAKANASDVDPRYYADIARKVAGSPEEFRAAMSNTGMNETDEEQEANYSDKYQDMVARVGQKAREQEKSNPVDIADLARRLAAIEASRKDK